MDKNALKNFTTELRKDLMEKIENKIKMFYVNEEFETQQKGDIYILSNKSHTLKLTNEFFNKRKLLINRIENLSLEQVIEEAAYTWFNRIIAIRYMEINDILPLTRNNQSLGIRVLSSKDNTIHPEILKINNLMNPELDINFKKEVYLEQRDENEQTKYILLLVCQKLSKVIPQVFGGITDYIDILVPDNLIKEKGIIKKIVELIPEVNFKNVEILGWLYQYYNQEEKDRVMSENRAYDKKEIPFVTQLFTPDWVVKYLVENSLGKYWLEHSSNQGNTENWKFMLKETSEKSSNNLNIENISFIDPCCGSGHILVYAFEIFYQIYKQIGYSNSSIPELILKNNIYGIDIDDRAWQLSILAIVLKAREYDKEIFNKDIIKQLNIVNIPESKCVDKTVLNELSEQSKEKAEYLIEMFKDAKNIGSLLLLKKDDYEQLKSEIEKNETIFGVQLQKTALPLINTANILSQKYDIVVTNPPYLTNKNMNKALQGFVNKYYEPYKRDLYSCFIKQCSNLTKENGYYALITIHTWMFLSAFKNLRNYILENNKIISMLHLGAGVFKEIAAFNVLATAFIIKNEKVEDYKGTYIRLVDYSNEEEKIMEFANKNNYYQCSQSQIRKIQDNVFLYYLSEKMLYALNNYKNIGSLFRIKPGLTTSNNAQFVRNWYEISLNDIGFNFKDRNEAMLSHKKWFPYNNGGNYRKWYGNNEAVVNWKNDGEDIRNYKLAIREKKPGFNVGIAALNDILKKGLTYSIFGFRNFGIRYKDYGFLFDVSGASIFPDDENIYYVLGYLASKVSFAFLSAIAPTVNFQAGDIASIPYVYNDKYAEEINNIVIENIKISKDDWDSFETSWDFKKHPLVSEASLNMQQIKEEQNNGFQLCNNLEDAYNHWKYTTNERFKKIKENEESLNQIFIDIYDLKDELTKDVDNEEITIRLANKERDIKSLISYAVGCMFGRYSLDKNGLIYAGGIFDENRYKEYQVDSDNIIPITDEAYFSDDIVERFKTFIKTVYDDNTFNENMDFIAEALGKRGTETSEETIRRYFVNDFFNDHIKIYQKRPIYWLLDSGKKNGFKALIYMHRYNENLIPKARLDYLHRVQTTYEKLLSDVNYKLTTDLSMTDKKEAKDRQTDLMAKLQEIKEYDEKIAHIANQRIDIDLDDGVKINYEKFKDILAKIK